MEMEIVEAQRGRNRTQIDKAVQLLCPDNCLWFDVTVVETHLVAYGNEFRYCIEWNFANKSRKWKYAKNTSSTKSLVGRKIVVTRRSTSPQNAKDNSAVFLDIEKQNTTAVKAFELRSTRLFDL